MFRGARNYDNKDNTAKGQPLDAALGLASLRKAMNSGEAQDYDEDKNRNAEKQKSNGIKSLEMQ